MGKKRTCFTQNILKIPILATGMKACYPDPGIPGHSGIFDIFEKRVCS